MIKMFEDYVNHKGKKVHTKGVDDKVLLSKMDKMSRWLKGKGIDVSSKSYDDTQQAYAKYLRSHPDVKGIWGEDSSMIDNI